MPDMLGDMQHVRTALQKFQDGYTARDCARLDEFMQLFVQGDDIELIGIGAVRRTGKEWFQGQAQVRSIVEGDWTYWGNVILDVAGAKITTHGDVAWLSTTGELVQTSAFDQAMPFYLRQMSELLQDERLTPDEQLTEATHFGLRRLRERLKGDGYAWPFTFTAVLLRVDQDWRFHTLHWAMPVD